MSGKNVVPALGRDSFSCPHCGALAHQSWYSIHHRRLKPDQQDQIAQRTARAPDPKVREALEKVTSWAGSPSRAKASLLGVPMGGNVEGYVTDTYISNCYSCNGIAIWVLGALAYPASPFELQPSPDLPEDVKADFVEAGLIVSDSPRGAAAILRLALQKLVVALGGKGENLNADIGALVQQGLRPGIQKALDIVRVIGNNAVHPGEIDIKDDRDTAIKLFHLINLIADTMITQANQIEALFDSLPTGIHDQIQKRDKPKK